MAKRDKTHKKKVIRKLKFLKGKEKPYKPSKVEVLPPPTRLKGPSSQNLPAILDATMMDSTSVTEISIMQNEKYAPQIINKMMKSNRLKNLLAIKKSGDISRFLNEGKEYIIDICRGMDSLEAHTSMFIVRFMIEIGRMLNEIYTALESNRSKYAKWVKENFNNQHTRYFQQSRELFAMGEYAIKHSSLGKNRLLQVNRLQDNKQYKEIIAQNPYSDITQDRQGIIFKEHTDAVVTLCNLGQGGIEFADFDQAYLLSCYNKQWIEQKAVKKIKAWLDKFPAIEEKKEAFENYIMDKMMFPSEVEFQPMGNLQSLNTILANLIIYYENKILPGQTDWMSSVNRNTFNRAKKIMHALAQTNIPEKIENPAKENPQTLSPVLEKKQSVMSKQEETK